MKESERRAKPCSVQISSSAPCTPVSTQVHVDTFQSSPKALIEKVLAHLLSRDHTLTMYANERHPAIFSQDVPMIIIVIIATYTTVSPRHC